MSRPYIVGLICARGGSKGVIRKNLRNLGGKPLIAWSIGLAKLCPSIDRIIVSTEDTEIADVARRYGAETPFSRPLELAQDSSPELLVWKHAIQSLNDMEGRAPDVLVNIPTTSPFREVQDVEGCIAKLLEKSADLCLTVRSSQRNPYFNMVRLNDGWASLAASSSTPVVRRQDAPELFDITTVAYAADADFVLRTDRLLNGRVCAIVIPEERSLDIDTELDLAFAEFLIQRREQINSGPI